MRVLVTGGAGFIGSHVADRLLELKMEVLIVDDLSSGREGNVPAAADFVKCDIRDFEALESAMSSFRPDVVCHQGAQTSVAVSTREPQRDASTNVLGTINLLESSLRHGKPHIVFASTGGAIYGDVPEGTRADIDTRPAPASPYACSKMAAEAYLQAYRYEHGQRSTILRYANVYGPRQDPHGEAGVVAIFARRLLAGEDVKVNAQRDEGDDGCVRDYVFVRDVVDTNVRAIRGEIEAPVVNVCTGVGTSTRALAHMIHAAAGSRAAILSAPRRAGDLERSVLEPSPAGAGRVELSAGIGLTVESFRTGA